MNQDENIYQALKEKEFRLTPQRMMILKALEKSEGHFSAEEIYMQVHSQYPHINISTIYRTIELLKGFGLVTEINLGDGWVRYHYGDKGRHHHLVCQGCGKIIELDEDTSSALEESILRNYDFKAELKHLAIFGHCGDCRRKRKK